MQKNLGHYYIYKFGVKENKKNWKKPNFKDDLISVEFTPNYNNIGIEIVNQSYEMVTVDWNRVRFEENDIVSNVLVWGSDFANKNEVLPVNILKPGQGMRTGIVPTELIDYAPKDSLANKKMVMSSTKCIQIMTGWTKKNLLLSWAFWVRNCLNSKFLLSSETKL